VSDQGTNKSEVKQQVRQFYDRIGWQMEGDFYQNARYEDLRPVSKEYIHRCHMRVKQHLKPAGRFLLDAGSGPIQYVEYLSYSENYTYRVCADISIVALQEAHKRIAEHGLFVVADVANLPFKADAFDGIVSLHTFHHLPVEEQPRAYRELYRVLAPKSSAAVVNGWTESDFMRRMQPLVTLMERLFRHDKDQSAKARKQAEEKERLAKANGEEPVAETGNKRPTGTFVRKLNAEGLRHELGSEMLLEIYPWRSASVRFLRAVIHTVTLGKLWLRLLFWLEDRYPRYFGEKGQYPLIVVKKN